MKFVDADKLRKEIPVDKYGHIETTITKFNIALEHSAIDAEPVKHGHWIEMTVSSGRDSWKCSLCGRRARGKTNNLPYCHCGAKMDEKIDS